MLRRGLFIGLLLAIPWSASAMQSTVWDFRNSQVPGNWEVFGFEGVQQEGSGLHISTLQEGQMLRTMDIGHPADVVSFRFRSNKEVTAYAVWLSEEGSQGQSVYFTIPAGEKTVDVNLIEYSTWDRTPAKIGFGLPANTEIQLVEITMSSWNVWERMGQLWKSFWTFDQMLPYSINFLWGPVLQRTPVGVEALFTTLPPGGWAFGRILLPFLGIVGVGLIALRYVGVRRWKTILGMRWHWGMFLIVFAAAWVLFDARMGVELLRYVKADYQSYVLVPPEIGKLRNYETIYYGVFANMDVLQQEPTYVFHAPPQTPFRSLVRYLTYPSLPIEQQNLTDSVRNWFIFERADIEIGPTQQLMFDGKALTPPGEIVTRFGDHSLLFRTFAPTQ